MMATDHAPSSPSSSSERRPPPPQQHQYAASASAAVAVPVTTAVSIASREPGGSRSSADNSQPTTSPSAGGGGGGGGSSSFVPAMSPPTYHRADDATMTAQTPWTLGSTDGSYATTLALMRQQQQQQQQEMVDNGGGHWGLASDGTPPESAAAAAAAAAVENSGVVGNGPVNQRLNVQETLHKLSQQQSLYQDRLFHQPSSSVETVLAAACEVMSFDIAELWLRTGPKTHQLTNSHLRPTALEDSVRQDLVEVYYGSKSSERTHRLSPALCKRAKEALDVVWVTAHTPHGQEALRCSISNVRTAVAVPLCHEASNTNLTLLFFSIRRIIVRPAAVEFLVHMSLAVGAAAVNSLSEDGLLDKDGNVVTPKSVGSPEQHRHVPGTTQSRSEHNVAGHASSTIAIRHQRVERFSITGAQLDLQWRQLTNVEYLTDGGNSWIHTAVFENKAVVVKTLKPECQDVVVAINEIEGELAVHSRLNHANIVSLIGAGTTSKGVRFVVLERLDGGTLQQMLGYDTRIRDRRRRFWRRKQFSFLDVLRIARSIAEAMTYCHEEAIPGSVVLHRDLKPDNIGFTLDGTVKILDFGLAKIVENASVDSTEVHQMSGETGSLRYMAPEVADALPYNFAADVYSFGIILWELNASKKPFEGLNRELFYERIVHGGERPPLNRKWPSELTSLMMKCWDADMHNRPKFRDIVRRLDDLIDKEKGGNAGSKKQFLPKLTGMIDRHSTWF